MLHLLIRFLLIIGLLGGIVLVFLNYRTQNTADNNLPAQQDFNQLIQKCGEDCEQKIKDIVSQAVATLSALPAQAGKPTSKVVPQINLQYINFNNVGLTTRNEWTDLDGTDFSYDSNTYGNVREVRWIPRIKTNSGGEASSRLFDVSNGTSVPGSEVSTRNIYFTEIESGILTLKSNKSTYRVQIKSTSGYETNFEKGKLKITIVE